MSVESDFYSEEEVVELLGVQAFHLRYWETEFSALAPETDADGERRYSYRDLRTVQRIKQLLFEDHYTVAGARRRLEGEASEAVQAGEPSKPDAAAGGYGCLVRTAADRGGGAAIHLAEASAIARRIELRLAVTAGRTGEAG